MPPETSDLSTFPAGLEISARPFMPKLASLKRLEGHEGKTAHQACPSKTMFSEFQVDWRAPRHPACQQCRLAVRQSARALTQQLACHFQQVCPDIR